MKVIEDNSESNQQCQEAKIEQEEQNGVMEEEKSPQDQQISQIKEENKPKHIQKPQQQNKWLEQVKLEKKIRKGYRFDENHLMKIKSYKEIKCNDKVTKEITFTIQNIPQKKKVQQKAQDQKNIKQSVQQVIPQTPQIVQEVVSQVKTRGQLKREMIQKTYTNTQPQQKVEPIEQKKQIKQRFMSERELQKQLELVSDNDDDIIRKK
ncbi:hypothetical protein pb186bvf_016717 [Paramecium bursaria]